MQRHADSKKKRWWPRAPNFTNKVCVRARHRCAFKTHVRLVHLRRTRVSVMCKASTWTRLRTFAQRGVALDQTRLWVSFALCHKQTRTVANLAYTSITSHLPNK